MNLTIIIMIMTSICLGFCIGTVVVLYQTKDEISMLEEELDFFRENYHRMLKQFKNKYTDD